MQARATVWTGFLAFSTIFSLAGEDIYDALENSLDPTQLMGDLSSSQKRKLENYRVAAEVSFSSSVCRMEPSKEQSKTLIDDGIFSGKK